MRRSRPGFTLVEIMMVVLVIGLMAAMVVPRVVRYYEPPMTALRRTVEELSDKALVGLSLRMRQETPKEGARRGTIVLEGFAKVPDPVTPGQSTLSWVPVKVGHPPVGDGWRLEPAIVYFYSDGSCTPARFSFAADPEAPDTEADKALLTVTGYLMLLEKKK